MSTVRKDHSLIPKVINHPCNGFINIKYVPFCILCHTSMSKCVFSSVRGHSKLEFIVNKNSTRFKKTYPLFQN